MKTLPTLFRTALPSSPAARKQLDETIEERLRAVREKDSALATSLEAIKPALRKTLLASVWPGRSQGATTQEIFETLVYATRSLTSERPVITAGIWDLNSGTPETAQAIALLNEPQKRIAFFPVRAPIQAGLISDPERVRAWLRGLNVKLQQKERLEVEANTIADDFYPQAESVLRDTGLDYMVGVTGSEIAFQVGEDVTWNYFTTGRRRTLLVSTQGLRTYAKRARRPVEVAIAIMILAELLVRINPKLDYHDETRGCLFDFNADRDSIVEGIKRCGVDEECLAKMRADFRQPTLDILKGLKSYKRSATE
jgi:hypothetical protein